MELIGEYLKSIRIKKKIRLKSVSDELKISVNILQNIERDYFSEYLDKVFLVGYIRSYSKYLNLDHNEIIQNFRIQVSYYETNLNTEVSKPIEINKSFSIPKTLSYFSVIIFTSGFYFLFIKANDFQSEYAMTPDVPENLIGNLEEIEMNISLSKIGNKKDQDLAIIKQQKIIENQLDIYHNSSSVIASLPNEQNLKELNENITLKFLNPTWIQLRNEKDDIILSKLMDKGDEYSYKTSDKYSLTAGNAGNIIISLDNIIIGKAGKVGEVIDSLIINKYFNQ
jgi:cytoskeletal protein RodZ